MPQKTSWHAESPPAGVSDSNAPESNQKKIYLYSNIYQYMLTHIPSNLSHLPYLKSVQSDITAMITINSRKRVIMNFDSILNFKLKSKQKN